MISTSPIANAVGSVPEKEDLRTAYEELRALSSSLSSFTVRWNDLEDHFSSIEKSIDLRLKELESKEKSLVKPLASRPKEEEKQENLAPATPRVELKELCVKMDGKGLRSFVNDNRKDLSNLRNEIVPAMQLASCPARLVLDAMDGFYPAENKGRNSHNSRGGELHASRRTCILLLESLYKLTPEISSGLRESAMKIAIEWKGKLSNVVENSVEAWAFLQLLATYGLVPEFDIDEILDLIIPISRRKPTIDVCKQMDIADKIPDLIEKLNSKGKHLDAVKFIFAFDLVEKFPPVPLLKAYLKESKKVAEEVQKKGHNSKQARNETTAKELSAFKAVIKAIEAYKLESECPLENLQKQVSRLEQVKVEKKRSTSTASHSAKNSQFQLHKRHQPDSSSTAATAAAKPLAPSSQTQALSMADHAAYLGSMGQYRLVGAGSFHDHGGPSLLGLPAASRSPPKSFLYSSGVHAGIILYDRPVAYDSRLSTYESRPLAYDSRLGTYNNVAASYEKRTTAHSNFNLSAGQPPQYPQVP